MVFAVWTSTKFYQFPCTIDLGATAHQYMSTTKSLRSCCCHTVSTLFSMLRFPSFIICLPSLSGLLTYSLAIEYNSILNSSLTIDFSLFPALDVFLNTAILYFDIVGYSFFFLSAIRPLIAAIPRVLYQL